MKNKEKGRFLYNILYFFKSVYRKIKGMRLLERIIERQKRLAGYDDEMPTKSARAGYVFGMARIVAVFLFIVLTVSILLFGGRIFTYNNVYYMFKDIGYITSFSESRPESLNYSRPVSNQSFANFKNGLAVVSDSEFKFFTSTGRVTMTEGSGYVNPKIVTSNVYALVYDGGRNSYSVYNSFVKLHSDTLDFPISYADMSDDGSYVLVTKSQNYTSVVKIYDSSFELVQEYSKNDYIISAEISDNGKYIAVVSLDANEGESVISINVLKKGSEKIYSSAQLYGAVPYKCSFISSDRLALFCSDRVFVYDLKGNVKGEYYYSSDISRFFVTEGAFLIALERDGMDRGNTVILFDKNGKELYTGNIDGNVRDISYGNNFIYVLRDTDVVRIDVRFGVMSYADIREEDVRLKMISDGEVVACTQTAAYYLEFK